VSIPISDVTALSLTLEYPGGSTVFSLSDVQTGSTQFTVGAGPPVIYAGGGNFVLSGNGASISIGPNLVPGLLAYLGVTNPAGTLTDVYGYWTTTQTGGVPEPSTWAMMLVSFAGLGFASYWRSMKGGLVTRSLATRAFSRTQLSRASRSFKTTTLKGRFGSKADLGRQMLGFSPNMEAMAENHDLARATARLDALTNWERRPRGKMRVGLEPMLDLARRLGDPQKSFRSIHVAGTKGKGSVSALIEAALARAGLSVGRYASPHVERITERVSVDGREIEAASLARALDRALDAYEAARNAGSPAAGATWFDLLTAAAFIIFAETQREWAVVEVGLGGRLDSTNIVVGEIAVVTNIGLEHTEILGKTRAKIAGEKVGVLKRGAALITPLDLDDEAGRVLQARADDLGSPVIRPRFGPKATIEELNVALAGAALDQLGELGVRAATAGDAAIGAWLLDANTRAAARLPGRMERVDIEIGPRRLPMVLDGAHVPFNLEAVLRDLSLKPDLFGPCVAIAALGADKDAEGFVTVLGKRASTIVFTDLPGSNRGRAPAELKALAMSLGLTAEAEPDAKHALKRGVDLVVQTDGWLLVTGSLYLVGALRSMIAASA
jgi:dihydrofolate synthase/folylpolyglutamate synthase